MSTIATTSVAAAVESVLIQGDLSKLNPDQRISYYKAVCESVGLNPLTKPFDYLSLSGKMVLYAKRDATDQLRKIHAVSVRITGRETIEGVYVVAAQATDKTGRVDESTGAVTIMGLKGDALANALMKAETKAKRRVTLSICGLGLLDETEIETIPGARRDEPAPQAIEGPKANGDDLFKSLARAIDTCENMAQLDAAKRLCNDNRDKVSKDRWMMLGKFVNKRQDELEDSEDAGVAVPVGADPVAEADKIQY